MDSGERPPDDDETPAEPSTPDADDASPEEEPAESPDRDDTGEPAANDTGSDRDAGATEPATDGTAADEATVGESTTDEPTTDELSTAGTALGEAAEDRPPAEPIGDREGSVGNPIHRFLNDDDGPFMWIREMLSSAAVVLVIGLLLFGLSGVWPPMVAIESGSMDPNMEKGDLVFVTEPGRFAPDAADNDLGIVTHEVGAEAGYESFGDAGSVIIFMPPDRVGSPIIHRAMFHVEEGENWHDRANPDYVRADDCDALTNCPAPNDGFVTKGDNNARYDQASGQAPPVADEWVTGVARVRVPYLGYVRLLVTGEVSIGDLLSTAVPLDADAVAGDAGVGPERDGTGDELRADRVEAGWGDDRVGDRLAGERRGDDPRVGPAA